MAADRTGTTVSSVLPAVNADAIEDVLSPVLNKDALLVTVAVYRNETLLCA